MKKILIISFGLTITIFVFDYLRSHFVDQQKAIFSEGRQSVIRSIHKHDSLQSLERLKSQDSFIAIEQENMLMRTLASNFRKELFLRRKLSDETDGMHSINNSKDAGETYELLKRELARLQSQDSLMHEDLWRLSKKRAEGLRDSIHIKDAKTLPSTRSKELEYKYMKLKDGNIDYHSIYVSDIKPALIYLIMLLGMVANQAYLFLEAEHKRTISIRRVFQATFRGTKFWTAILVSPLVFGYLIYAVDGINKELPCYLLGFQNGFFWHTVFSRINRQTIQENEDGKKNETSAISEGLGEVSLTIDPQ